MLLSLLGLLVGCPAPEPEDTGTPDPPTIVPPTVPWQAVVVEVGERSAHAEQVSDTATLSAVPIEPAEVLTVQGDEVRVFDALGVPELLAYDVAPVWAAAWWDDTLLMATDDGLVAYDDGLVETELDAAVTGVTGLLTLKSGLWMQTADGLAVLRGGALQAVTVEGVRASGFARGTTGLAPVVWTHAADRVVAVNWTDAGLVAFEAMTMFGPVSDVAATRDGDVLALVEGWLVRRTAANEWERLDVGEPVRELRGHRGGTAVWARTDTTWLHVSETIDATQVPVAAEAREDAHGRLIEAHDAGVTRWALDFPLLLLDVPEGNVLTAAEVRVVPTAVDLEPTLSVTATSVAGDEVPLAVDDYRFTLDPEQLAPGPWTIEASAAYADTTSVATATVVIGADFEPTWPDHIQPIYTEKCTPCHEGDQGIVGLSTEAAWVDTMLEGTTPGSPGILERILVDNMPSDTRELTATEKYLVSEWRDLVLP